MCHVHASVRAIVSSYIMPCEGPGNSWGIGAYSIDAEETQSQNSCDAMAMIPT